MLAVVKLLIDAGKACEKLHDETVMYVNTQRIQGDKIWSFIYSKQKNVSEGMEENAGDASMPIPSSWSHGM